MFGNPEIVEVREYFLRKLDSPDTVATFDREVRIFARVKQPMKLVSVFSHSKLRETCMVIASVCWFCAIVLILVAAIEAMSRHEGELCPKVNLWWPGVSLFLGMNSRE